MTWMCSINNCTGRLVLDEEMTKARREKIKKEKRTRIAGITGLGTVGGLLAGALTGMTAGAAVPMIAFAGAIAAGIAKGGEMLYDDEAAAEEKFIYICPICNKIYWTTKSVN